MKESFLRMLALFTMKLASSYIGAITCLRNLSFKDIRAKTAFGKSMNNVPSEKPIEVS